MVVAEAAEVDVCFGHMRHVFSFVSGCVSGGRVTAPPTGLAYVLQHIHWVDARISRDDSMCMVNLCRTIPAPSPCGPGLRPKTAL